MKFIQIGVGGFGRCWLNALKENRKAKMVGLVDLNEDALQHACDFGNYSRDICFTDYRKALSETNADAVVVVTPPKLHRAPVVAAMKAGLHVISEKPMAESPADCKAMLKASRDTNRCYVVSQNYRYSEPMQALANVIRSGKLGPVGQVKIDFYMGVNFAAGFRGKMDYPVIVDMAIHHFDLLRFITGLDAVKVSGASWNPPWSNYDGDCSSTALFEMDNGATALYNASWCAKGQFCDWNANWQIECEKGTVTYNSGQITIHEAPELYTVKKTKPVKPRKMKLSGQAYVLDEFIRCIPKGEEPATCAIDNIRSISMVFATVKAMKSGKRVAVLDPSVERMIAGK